MQMKFVVKREDEPSPQDPQIFDQEVITIGRDPSSLLYLPDPKRIVGRLHARLERKGDLVHLIDLGSRNGTFFKDEMITAEKPYVVSEGDQFRIGDFVIKFEGLVKKKPAAQHPDITIMDPGIANPFIEDAQQLASVFKQIYAKYEARLPHRRDGELKEALSEELKKNEAANIAAIISDILKPAQTLPLPMEPVSVETGRLSMTDRIRHLCDVLLTAFAKLVKAPRHFRNEFMGETIFKATKTFAFHSSTLQEIREFLLATHISDQDFKNRVEFLSKEADEVMLHQVALMDGYKVSVNEGSRHILNHFDPNALRKILDKQSIKLGRIEIPYRYLPILYHWKLLQLYQQKYLALAGEDKGVFENKMFRPGFINAYYERLSSARSEAAGSKKQEDF